MNFHERKHARKEYYEKYIKGWKLRPCSACNGSGYYDHNGSPECGACDGSGKERYNSNEEDYFMENEVPQSLEAGDVVVVLREDRTQEGSPFIVTKEFAEKYNPLHACLPCGQPLIVKIN
jgi:hypothetical protein